MKIKLTGKSNYIFGNRKYLQGEIIELDSWEQIPKVFRQFFTIVENAKCSESEQSDVLKTNEAEKIEPEKVTENVKKVVAKKPTMTKKTTTKKASTKK